MTLSNPPDLYASFASWLDRALEHPLPPDAVAFCFNLYEHEDSYVVQMGASTTFNPANEAWCQEAVLFTEEGDLFRLPRMAGDEDWRRALVYAISLISYYRQNGKHATSLRAARGIGCGFVDGDLHVLPPVT